MKISTIKLLVKIILFVALALTFTFLGLYLGINSEIRAEASDMGVSAVELLKQYYYGISAYL